MYDLAIELIFLQSNHEFDWY